MKLQTSKIAGFLTKPDPAVRVILIYGPDAGLVRERGTALAKSVVSDLADPFRVTVLTPGQINEDGARLYDEMAAQALGGGRRLVRVPHATEAIAPSVAKLIADLPPSDSLLLIEAGDLDKRSKLRAACEGDSAASTGIPCYAEDAAARARTVADILKGEKISADPRVLTMLAEMLPPDRLALRSELDKLALYVGSGQTLRIEDVQACIRDGAAAELDDLVYTVGGGNAAQAAMLIDRLYAEQTAPVAILRAAQRHFLRIQLARAHMATGSSANDAVKRLSPPVFWKFESAFTAQLHRWPPAKAAAALRRLVEAEAAVKRTGTPDAALCAQTLLGLAA